MEKKYEKVEDVCYYYSFPHLRKCAEKEMEYMEILKKREINTYKHFLQRAKIPFVLNK